MFLDSMIQKHGVILIVACVLLTARTVHAAGVERDVESYDYVLGTQTFAPTYSFTNKTRLVETAEVIRAMGSNIIKFDMSVRAFRGYRLPHDSAIHTLTELADREPSCRRVLRMPFTFYFLWAYAHSVRNSAWRNGLADDERDQVYREMLAFTKYLLTTYRGTGKTFFLGHWEGDWALLGSFDRNRTPRPEAVQGMIDWLNVRQQAIDDAKAEVVCHGVQVYQYTEVNLVQKAMHGETSVTNSVLPHTHVDFVSYSSYDSLRGSNAVLDKTLRTALDYIESKLPAKPEIDGKRVFIGEYGFPLVNMDSPEMQDERSRSVIRAALAWGCPFVLYWQMYCNEMRDGKPRGFWLIDDQRCPQPIYETHKRFLEWARQFVIRFKQQNGRLPTRAEYRTAAVNWLEHDDAAANTSKKTQQPTDNSQPD